MKRIYTGFPQHIRRANSRHLQNLGGADRSRRKDHFFGCLNLMRIAIYFRLNANRFPAFQNDTLCQGFCDYS